MTAESRIDPQRLIWLLKIRRAETGKPVPGQYIANFFGVKEKKRVREAIAELRKNGEPIVSCQAGYYWPATVEEAYSGLHYLTHDLAARRAAHDGMKRGVEKYFGPEQLPLEVA